MSVFVVPEEPDFRRGEYLRTELDVWWCGDEVCDCRQVVVERIYRNAVHPKSIVPVRIWEGAFCTEGTGEDQIRHDLRHAREDMARRFPSEALQDVSEWST